MPEPNPAGQDAKRGRPRGSRFLRAGWLRWGLRASPCCCSASALLVRQHLLGQNLHTVLAGRVYVAPSDSRVAGGLVREHGIRTIVNTARQLQPDGVVPGRGAASRSIWGSARKNIAFRRSTCRRERDARLSRCWTVRVSHLFALRAARTRTGRRGRLLLLQEGVPTASARGTRAVLRASSFGRQDTSTVFSPLRDWLRETGKETSLSISHWCAMNTAADGARAGLERVEPLKPAQAMRPIATGAGTATEQLDLAIPADRDRRHARALSILGFGAGP